jgi:hypothetical protein
VCEDAKVRLKVYTILQSVQKQLTYDALTFRASLVLYLIVLAILTAPYWTTGMVVAPYRVQIAYEDIPSEAHLLKQVRLSDYYNVFIPEIHENLNGERAGWLKYWTSNTELGRPLYHTSGFSPGFFPSFLLSLLTNDPSVFLTILSWSTIALFGFFVLVLAREWQLHPVTGLLGGCAAATTPYMMAWLTFPVFLSSVCWGVGVLYTIVRVQRRADVWSAGFLAFAMHALLMTAYPQTIVYFGYLVGGYTFVTSISTYHSNRLHAIRTVGLLVVGILIGVLSALPLYLDIALLSQESQRLQADYSFFKNGVSRFSLSPILKTISRLANPEVYGVSISPEYPFVHSSSALTPVVSLFAYVGMLTHWKKTRYWIITIGLLLVMGYSPWVYRAAVEHFGFGISRHTPFDMLKIPYLICMLYGIEALRTRQSVHNIRRAVGVAVCIVLFQMVVTLYLGAQSAYTLDWTMIVVGVALVTLIALQYVRPVLAYLMVVVILTIGFYDYPLMLRFPVDATQTRSPLVRTLQNMLADGSVMAVVPKDFYTIPTNYTSFVELPSIHSTNSLSSFRYGSLIRALNGKTASFGRDNFSINPDFQSTAFWMSNIGAILSIKPIEHPGIQLVYTVEYGGKARYYVYQNSLRMGNVIQIVESEVTSTAETQIEDPRVQNPVTPQTLRDVSDLLEYGNALTVPNILIVSQKFHPFWEARVEVNGTWQKAETTQVNGVFLGVHVPAAAKRVQLQYNPYSRWLEPVVCAWGVFFGVYIIAQVRKRMMARHVQ